MTITMMKKEEDVSHVNHALLRRAKEKSRQKKRAIRKLVIRQTAASVALITKNRTAKINVSRITDVLTTVIVIIVRTTLAMVMRATKIAKAKNVMSAPTLMTKTPMLQTSKLVLSVN